MALFLSDASGLSVGYWVFGCALGFVIAAAILARFLPSERGEPQDLGPSLPSVEFRLIQIIEHERELARVAEEHCARRGRLAEAYRHGRTQEILTKLEVRIHDELEDDRTGY